jgi:hypothetical protein
VNGSLRRPAAGRRYPGSASALTPGETAITASLTAAPVRRAHGSAHVSRIFSSSRISLPSPAVPAPCRHPKNISPCSCWSLLIADVAVLQRRGAGELPVVADDRRANENQQVGLGNRDGVVAEQAPEQRDITEQRHALLRALHVVLDQAAEHHDARPSAASTLVWILRSLVIRSAAAAEAVTVCAGEAVHLLLDIQHHRIALVDLRRHRERDADVWRSMVWKGFCAPLLPPVLVKEPVMNGTFWPTVM